MDLTLICAEIDRRLAQNSAVLVAIDGNCTAGKTTLAATLAARYDCNVFHMDDFFLRPQQRTPQRYAESGGNVDYERFYTEVLLPLKENKPFSFRKYDCSIQALGAEELVQQKQLTIIEGTYSTHPYFKNPYDLTIFLGIDPTEQEKRVRQRPQHLHQAFFERWIPMEEQYFNAFSIADHCDLIFRT